MDKLKKNWEMDYIPPLPKKTVVAMAYIPYQNAENYYSVEQGMENGTIFPELNKKFTGKCTMGGHDK